jgi:hypothetical protein
MPKQIFLHFTGKLDMSTSPRHIRVPKPKKETDLRHLTRSQLASNDSKKVKNLKLFSLPLEKDYFNRKIKKTVRHYFQARRTSIGGNFYPSEQSNDKLGFSETPKSDFNNHRIFIELDPTCEVSERGNYHKGVVNRLVPALAQVSPISNRDSAFSQLEMTDGRKYEKYKKLNINIEKQTSNKCDQGLQTEEMLLNS